MKLIIKAKAASQGETRTWADGKTRKKTGSKWVIIEGGKKSPDKQQTDSKKRAQTYFDYSMTTNLGDLVEATLTDHGLTDFDSLVTAIKTGPRDTAHTIYKDLISRVRSGPGTVSDKKAVSDLFGRSLIQLRDLYVTQPKARLTVTKTSKKGVKYRAYAEGSHNTELPVITASRIQADKKKMGGWSITGKLSTTHINAMIKTKTATLLSGTPKVGKPWIMPKKAEDMDLTYKGTELSIRVKQSDQKKQRTKTTARVEIKIPYTFAKAFLLNQIASKRTRNNFIFRLEHSAGYRDYLDKFGAMKQVS